MPDIHRTVDPPLSLVQMNTHIFYKFKVFEEEKSFGCRPFPVSIARGDFRRCRIIRAEVPEGMLNRQEAVIRTSGMHQRCLFSIRPLTSS